MDAFFDFATRPAGAARLQREGLGRGGGAGLRGAIRTVGSHREQGGDAVFTDTVDSGEQQGVGDGVFMQKSG